MACEPLRADDPSPVSLLFPSGLPAARRGVLGRGRISRRTAAITVPVMAMVAAAVLVPGLLMGHVVARGRLTANQPGATPATLGTYPGQLSRGVFQVINRIVASGGTIVTTGGQASDGLVRQQFFVSADGGRSWRLAPLRSPDGGQVPLGHRALLVAGGPGEWLAIGPRAIWTSRDGTSWTLASARGISPQLPGDSVWVITKTAAGFLAAGKANAAGGGTQAVIWTSRDGLTWQRMTAAGLGLAPAGEAVRSISYAASRGDDTVIAGTIAAGGATYSGAWLSTNGGTTWTRVSIPADHGAGDTITGLASGQEGLVAVRVGGTSLSTAYGVAYFSPNGRGWQYAGTIDAAGGWRPGVVKGSADGFVVTGQTAAGIIVAYTSGGTGASWRKAGSLGPAARESVTSATVAPGGVVVAVGATRASPVSQRPVFLRASPRGGVRTIPVAGISGGLVREKTVHDLAVAPDGAMVAVGSADGYPAVWHSTPGGGWRLVSTRPVASAYPGLTALTSVARGPSGWLAVGAPGPIVLTSADGTTWRRAGGPIEEDLGAVSAVAAVADQAGYSIVARPAGPYDTGGPDIWWSRNMTAWTRARVTGMTSGPAQVLAVAADEHGFVAAGSRNRYPAVWTTANGRLWTAIVLGLPYGASSAVLRHVAADRDRVVAVGQETRPDGTTVPFAELSDDSGASWHQVSFGSAGPDTVITALCAGPPGGLTAAGRYGAPGRRMAVAWTSATGAAWTPVPLSEPGGAKLTSVAALGPSGSSVTGIGSVQTYAGQRIIVLSLP